MDIIAYGAASKEKRRAEELASLLGPDVEGGEQTLQARLEKLMNSMDDVTRLANRVIIRDAINLMKAEARLNTIVQAKKFGMEHMIFDDLLDLSGIDAEKSIGYVHDPVLGEMIGGDIVTKNIDSGVFEKVVLVADEKPDPNFNIALNKPVSAVSGIAYDTGRITDGSIVAGGSTGYSYVAGEGEIEVDLVNTYKLSHIKLYLWYGDERYYHENRVKVSSDGVNWTTLYDSDIDGEVVSTSEGQRIDVGGLDVRYIRSHLNGNTKNTYSHWVEITAHRQDPLVPVKKEFYISMDLGETWWSILPEEVFLVDPDVEPQGLMLKASGEPILLNYGLLWT